MTGTVIVTSLAGSQMTVWSEMATDQFLFYCRISYSHFRKRLNIYIVVDKLFLMDFSLR